MIDKRLLQWFAKHSEHVLSHYLDSVSAITKKQRTKYGGLDKRRQPAVTVLELLAIKPSLNQDLLDNEFDSDWITNLFRNIDDA